MAYNTFQQSTNSTHPSKKCKYSSIENPQCHLLHPQNNNKSEMMDVSQVSVQPTFPVVDRIEKADPHGVAFKITSS